MSDETPRGLRFGSVAERYERFRPGYPDQAIDLLVSDDPRRALEIGAGTGKATRLVAGRGVVVAAVEPDPAMAAVLRRTTHGLPVTVLESTLEQLPDHEPVDLLFSAAAWHWTDPASRYDRAASLLRPGGVFACMAGPTDLADDGLRAEVDRLWREATGPDPFRDSLSARSGTWQWPGQELVADDRFTKVSQHVLASSTSMSAAYLVGRWTTTSDLLRLPEEVGERLLSSLLAVLPDPVAVRRDVTVHLARRVG